MHVLADTMTSLLAIAALVAGRWAGWRFLDPLMGVVGGIVIMRWSVGLGRGAGRQLLDVVPSLALAERVRERLEALDDVKISDLHLWKLSPGRHGCIISLVTSQPRPTEEYRAAVLGDVGIAHLTIEVHRCEGDHPLEATSSLSIP